LNAAAGAPAFPWEQAMRLGLGLLRLSPKEFWAMTPREFACAARALFPAPDGAPDRSAFEALMRRFPDREGQ
jgi:uncharacterized phage protein (TIGR02216 family)